MILKFVPPSHFQNHFLIKPTSAFLWSQSPVPGASVACSTSFLRKANGITSCAFLVVFSRIYISSVGSHFTSLLN